MIEYCLSVILISFSLIQQGVEGSIIGLFKAILSYRILKFASSVFFSIFGSFLGVSGYLFRSHVVQ